MKNLDGTAIGKIDHSLSHACRTIMFSLKGVSGGNAENVRTRRLGI